MTTDISSQQYTRYNIDYFTISALLANPVNRGSYISANVLLNLLNELRKSDKMRGLPSILSLFRKFNKFNKTGALMLDSIYNTTLKLF